MSGQVVYIEGGVDCDAQIELDPQTNKVDIRINGAVEAHLRVNRPSQNRISDVGECLTQIGKALNEAASQFPALVAEADRETLVGNNELFDLIREVAGDQDNRMETRRGTFTYHWNVVQGGEQWLRELQLADSLNDLPEFDDVASYADGDMGAVIVLMQAGYFDKVVGVGKLGNVLLHLELDAAGEWRNLTPQGERT